MIQTWEARRFESVLGGGRTKPLLLDCERSEGSARARERFVVKAHGLPEIALYSLCNELLGAFVGTMIGVPCVQPAMVDISADFEEATRESLAGRGLRLTPGVAVGTRYVPGLTPMPPSPSLRPEDISAAASIYALDMAIQNPDRRRTNPNCAYDGGAILAYDFESAFSFRFAIGTRVDPWDVTRFGFHRDHVFHAALRLNPVNWGELLAVYATLTAETLNGLCGTLPEDWRETAQPAVEHLLAVSEHVTEFERELVRSVA